MPAASLALLSPFSAYSKGTQVIALNKSKLRHREWKMRRVHETYKCANGYE